MDFEVIVSCKSKRSHRVRIIAGARTPNTSRLRKRASVCGRASVGLRIWVGVREALSDDLYEIRGLFIPINAPKFNRDGDRWAHSDVR